MKLSEFTYTLPKNAIAQKPTRNRDESKLMIVNKKERTIEHKKFKHIIDYFEDGDVMIVNNTKVFPARLYGRKEKTGAKIEVFLLRELNKEMRLWDVMVDPARKIRVGNKIYFQNDDEMIAEVVDNTTSRGRTIRFIFNGEEEEFEKKLFEMGETPLPKYIKRKPGNDDEERYQTLFAKHEGAVAAPTAGLHFSHELIKRLQIKGIEFAEVTLHVGMASFNAIDVEDLGKYKMDAEFYRVEAPAVELVNKAKANNKKICCVGTTTMRAIESSVTSQGELKTGEGWSSVFIYPPYNFSIANCMATNFHLPKSSLFVMATAFAEWEILIKAYKEAVKNKYRFYSYGDSMLII